MWDIVFKKGMTLFILCILMSVVMIPWTVVMKNDSVLGFEQGRTTECLQYTFPFHAPRIQTKELAGFSFFEIQLPGCNQLGMHPGDPTVPVKSIQLLLPPQMTVDAVIVTGTPIELKIPMKDFTAGRLIPAQEPVPFGGNTSTSLRLNEEIYTSDDLYPALPNEEYHLGYSHGYTILDMTLCPIQVIPAEGGCYYYPHLTVNISLTQNQEMNPFFRGTPEDEAWVKSLVCNPEMTTRYDNLPTFEYSGGLCDPSEEYDYVIITTEQNSLDHWQTGEETPYNWESLMQRHTMEGLSCILVTKQAIDACPDYYNTTPLFNDSQAHIREFCRDAYQDWNTQYVLVGADAEFIPARLMSYDYEYDVDSDLYWSNLDNSFNADHDSYWGETGDSGFDVYSELFLGRIPCDIPKDVSNWLTKSFIYADATNPDYLENGGFFAANSSGWPGTTQGDDIIDFAAINGTDGWLGPAPDQWPGWLGFLYGFETWNSLNPDNAFNLSVRWTYEDPNPGWNQGNAVEEFRNAINTDSVTLITGIGHADSEMSLDVSATDWQMSYHNTRPFFIIDLGGHCGDMDASDDGVLGTMLFSSDSSLSFGCVYNSGFSWTGGPYCTNSSDALQTKLFWDYFFDITNNSGDYQNWRFGKALAWSKDTMAPTLNWGFTWRGTLEDRLLFADPAQLLRPPNPNNPPQTPSLSWSPTIGLTLSTTDPDGDDVFYLVDWGDGTVSEWLGPYHSGEEATMNHTWTMPGTYLVRGKAKDIHTAVSDWSDPVLVEIPSLELTIHGGLGLTVTIINPGPLPISNVSWTITLNGGLILFGESKTGVIKSLPAAESTTVKSFLLGFGKTMVTATVSCEDGETINKTAMGLILGIFVVGVR